MSVSDLNTGLTALQTSQQVMDLIGENIANANTPGYHLQVPDLAEQTPSVVAGISVGNGVQLSTVQRMIDTLVEQNITAQASASSNTNTQLNTLQQIQTSLTPSSGSLDNLIDQFFNQVQGLAAQPADLSQRSVVLGSAADLAGEFNSMSSGFQQMNTNLDSQLANTVQTINNLAPQIAALNSQIQRVEITGVSANDQLDQRDALVNQLAQYASVQVVPQDFGMENVLVGGVPVVLNTDSSQLQFNVTPAGQAVVTPAGSTQAIADPGGQLGALLLMRNQAVPTYQDQLNTLAQGLASGLDEVQATGLGLSGPSTFLSGQRAVSSVTAPLSDAGLAFPPQAGQLFVTVTDLSTGQRTTTPVAVNPSESLQDLATALSGVSHVQALADSQTGTLQILAQPGYAIDFAGRLDQTPDTSDLTGTTAPQVGGSYTGASNDVYTFQAQGSGTVGVTPNLTLQVKDSAGAVVASLNIGQGYSPGSALQVANGVTLQLASGTINANDSFSEQVIARPDTAGILPALGINTLFVGDNAGNLQVNPNLVNQPGGLAASLDGQSSDSSNLQRMLAVSQTPTLANGTQTPSQFYATMVGNIGTQVQDQQQEQSTQQAVTQQLQSVQQSVSGVDTNQELIQMLQYQRTFQMASEYVNVVNTTLNQLFQLLSSPTVG